MILKKLRIEHINITVFIIGGIINLINCITMQRPLWQYFVYVFPFISFALIQAILNFKVNRKINAIIFLILSVLSVAFGDRGNLTGATFLFFAIYAWGNDRFTYVTLILSLFTMVSTFVYKGYTIPQSVNYIAGYTYFIAIYFIMMHPKKARITAELEEETVEIIQNLVMGLKPKQIADKLNMSTEAVNKQIQRARDKMEVGNNEQMIYLLSKNGQISQ